MDIRVYRDRLEYMEFLVNLVNGVNMALRVNPEKKDFRVSPDHLDPTACQASVVARDRVEREDCQDQRGHLDLLDRWVNKELMALRA